MEDQMKSDTLVLTKHTKQLGTIFVILGTQILCTFKYIDCRLDEKEGTRLVIVKDQSAHLVYPNISIK